MARALLRNPSVAPYGAKKTVPRVLAAYEEPFKAAVRTSGSGGRTYFTLSGASQHYFTVWKPPGLAVDNDVPFSGLAAGNADLTREKAVALLQTGMDWFFDPSIAADFEDWDCRCVTFEDNISSLRFHYVYASYEGSADLDVSDHLNLRASRWPMVGSPSVPVRTAVAVAVQRLDLRKFGQGGYARESVRVLCRFTDGKTETTTFLPDTETGSGPAEVALLATAVKRRSSLVWVAHNADGARFNAHGGNNCTWTSAAGG